MTLPDTLPDVPAEDWFQQQAQKFQQQAQAQIDSLHSGAAMDAVAAPLAALPTLTPPAPPAPPPNPLDDIFGGNSSSSPPPTVAPPPAPPPEAPPAAPQPFEAPPSPAPAAPSPVAPPAQPQAPTGDFFGDALTQVARAGGDASKFADDFGNRVSQSAGDSGAMFGHALTAAASAGADPTQFAQNWQPPTFQAPPTPDADLASLFEPPPQASQAAARSSAGLGTGEIDTSGRPNSPIDNSSREAFARSFAPYAQYISAKTGIAPDLITAMSGSESNFGNAPGNELFGIKALPGQKSQSLATHEGEWGGTNMNQDFAAYDTPGESADAYANLITKHYPNAVGAQTAQDLAHGLKQGGYFTANEQEYANSLAGIQKQVSGPVNAALAGGATPSTAGGVSDTSGLDLSWLGGGGGGGSAGGGMPAQGSGTATSRGTGGLVPVEAQRQFEQEAGLSPAEAYSACGPVAAAAFAANYGRQPTPSEAIDLAKSVGWTSASGMAGIGSEQALLNKMGVSTHLTQGVDWSQVQQDATSGNPVIISMGGHGEGHYIYVDGYDPSTGAFHGGNSTGVTLKGGSDWVTPADLQRMGWNPESALFADNPASPQPSPTATTTPNPPVTNSSVINDKAQQVQSAVQDVGSQPQTQAAPRQQPVDYSPPPMPGAAQQPAGAPQADTFTRGSQPPTSTFMGTDQAATPAQPTPAASPIDQFKNQIGDAFASLLGPLLGGAQAGQAAVSQLATPAAAGPTTGTATQPEPGGGYTVPTTAAQAQAQRQTQQLAEPAVQGAPVDVPSQVADNASKIASQAITGGVAAVTNAEANPDLQQNAQTAARIVAGPAGTAAAQQAGQIGGALEQNVDQPLTQWGREQEAKIQTGAQGGPSTPFLGGLEGMDPGGYSTSTGRQRLVDISKQLQADPNSVSPQDRQYAQDYTDWAVTQAGMLAGGELGGVAGRGLVGGGLAAAGEAIPALGRAGEAIATAGGAEGVISRVATRAAQASAEGSVSGFVAGAAGAAAPALVDPTIRNDPNFVSNVINAGTSMAEQGALIGGVGGAAGAGLGEVGRARNAARIAAEAQEAGIGPLSVRTLTPDEANLAVHGALAPAGTTSGQYLSPAEAVSVARGEPGPGEAPRTPIGEGGLGTPRYAYPAGSNEATIADTLRSDAQAQPQGVARPSQATLDGMGGLPSTDPSAPSWQKGLMPHVDDLRYAQDIGMPQAQWYNTFASKIADTVGVKNVNEFRTLFGITSQQTAPVENLQYTLGFMRMAREFQQDGTPMTARNIRQWMTDNPVTLAKGNEGKWAVNMGQVRKVADLYNKGAVSVASNAKTSSYSSNILSALLNRFDPNSTMDTWMAQVFNYGNPNRVAGSDAAYRAMRTVTDHLAGETGQVPHQAQAAIWFAIKGAKDFARTKEAPKDYKALVTDFVNAGKGKPNNGTTLRQVLERAQEVGAYDKQAGTWEEVAGSRQVSSELGKLKPLLDANAPRPPVADSSYLYYPGKGTKLAGAARVGGSTLHQTALTPDITQGRRVQAEAQAPTVAGNITDDARETLGYNGDTRQFEALGNVPHEVQGDQVLVPGGNMDTLRYVAARIQQASGEDAGVAHLHMYDPDGPGQAGWHLTEVPPENVPQLRQDLNAAGINHQQLADGTIRVNALPIADATYEDALAAAVERSGGALEQLNGHVQTASPAYAESTLSRLGPRYGAAGLDRVPELGGSVSGGAAGARGYNLPGNVRPFFGEPDPNAPITRDSALLHGLGERADLGRPSRKPLTGPLDLTVRPMTQEQLAQATRGASMPSGVTSDFYQSIEDAARATREEEPQARTRGRVSDTGPEQRAGAAGEVFNRQSGQPVPPRGGEDFAGNIRLPKYVQPEVASIIHEVHAADPARFEAARRGVVTDQMVRDLADEAGTSVNRVAAAWKPGRTTNAETTLALRTALADRALRVRSAQLALRQRPSSVEARQNFVEALNQHAALQEVVAGVSGEAGRTVRQFRQPITGEQASLAAMQRIAKRAKMSNTELADHLATVDLNDPQAVAQLAKTLTTHNFASKAQAIWYFNLLSSPVTWTRNGISNAITAAARPAETLAAGGIDLARSTLTRSERQRYLGEAPAEIVGMLHPKTWGDSLGDAIKTMRTGITPQELENPELAGRFEPFKGRAADLTVNVPGRVLSATDVFFRGLNARGSMYKLAYRQAAREGVPMSQIADRVNEIVRNPDQSLLTQAGDEAAYRVFQNRNELATRVAQVREAMPYGTGRLVLPFINTPVNVGAYAMERSPLAALKLLDKDQRGGGQLSDNLARMTLGSALAGYAAIQGYNGNISGAQPDDPTERDAWQREGKQPYSFRTPDGVWRSYQALQPFSTLLAAGAAAGDAWKKGQNDPTTGLNPASLAAVTGVAAGRAMVDQPWLQGLSGLIDMMTGNNQIGQPSDPIKQISTNAQHALASGVTPAGLRLLARAFDPTVRTSDPGIEGFPQALAAGIPGLTQYAPSRLGAFGQPQQRPGGGGLGAIDPFQSTSQTNDPVEKELRRLQNGGYAVEPGLAARKITLIGESMNLTPDQQRQYQMLSGVLTHDVLASVMESDAYRKLPADQQAKVINSLSDRVAEGARKTLYPSLIDQALEQKISQINQRAANTASPDWASTSAAAPTGAAATAGSR